ncbi:MAG: class IV adenylate cyclase [Sedimentisphaeraceae bacterium JB056]
MAIENEIKIKVDNHASILEKLKTLDSHFEGTIYQKDCYFDNSAADMITLGCCLRLRSESDVHGNLLKSILCYKGRKIAAKIKSRTELETLVSEPGNTEDILTALGYSISLSFNKKRTTWLLNDCEVCLDLLPALGAYVEIEGPSEEKVIATAELLDLNINEQEQKSYANLVGSFLREKQPERREIYLDTDQSSKKDAGITQTSSKPTDKNLNGIAHIIINPSSGSGFASSITNRIKDFLKEQSMNVRLDVIEEFSDISTFVDIASSSPDCKLVVACGGDGTIREVIQCLRGSEKPLMILPGGTENLLAHELGCDKELDTYKMMYNQQMISPLDVATVNGCCFTSVLGIGFDAEIVELLSKKRSGNITHTDYIWPIWRAFWAHEMPEFVVIADGKEIFRGSGMMFAGNISRYATGLRILKEADFGDGLLDVCIFPCKGKQDILKYFSMTMLQIHTRAAEVVYKKCRKLQVEPLNNQILTQIDGDPGPSLPLDIQIVPSTVQVYNTCKSR